MTSSKLKSSYSPLSPPLSTTIQSEINSIIITTLQLLPTHANEFHKLCRTKKNNHHTATSPFSQSAFLSLSSSPPQPTPPPAAFSFFYNPLRTCGLSVKGYSVPQRTLLCPPQQDVFFDPTLCTPPRPRIATNNCVSCLPTHGPLPTPHTSPSVLTNTAGSCKTTRRGDDFFLQLVFCAKNNVFDHQDSLNMSSTTKKKMA